MEEAEQADRICILVKGKVVSFGTPDEVKSLLVERYLLIDAADRHALRAELVKRGIVFTETPQFKIKVSDESLHRLLKTIDTPLTVINIHSPSVEDAYLAILEQHDDTE